MTFVYTEKPAAQGSVTERFVDEAGKRIAPDKTLTGQVGDLYEARPIEISDYAFPVWPKAVRRLVMPLSTAM